MEFSQKRRLTHPAEATKNDASFGTSGGESREQHSERLDLLIATDERGWACASSGGVWIERRVHL
jgi:hypothetical protein